MGMFHVKEGIWAVCSVDNTIWARTFILLELLCGLVPLYLEWR